MLYSLLFLLILEIMNVLSYMFDNCWDTTGVNFAGYTCTCTNTFTLVVY